MTGVALAMRGWRTCGALAVAAATLGSGCRSDRGAAARKPAPSTHTVTIEAVSYAPQSLTVNVGDTVVWLNKDPFPHTATSSAGNFDSREIAGDGASWAFTTTRAGDFPYTCTLHPTMTGVLHIK
jgi:plastocyanin